MNPIRIDLLHILGDVSEGRWAIFSLPHGDGSQMVSVIIPHTLWSLVSRQNPFSSDIALMEQIGTAAISRRLDEGGLTDPVIACAEDVNLPMAVDRQWFSSIRRCERCGQDVPPGEILEGLSNALLPNSRGEVEILVLCPPCQVQTKHRLTPYGIPLS
jgi:hypothetical protein